MNFVCYKKRNKQGKVIFDCGWALQIGRFIIKWNKQDSLNALEFKFCNKYVKIV